MKHLAKYAAGYAKTFPSSPVLLVRSTGRQFLKSAKDQIADLAKATEFLNEKGLLGTGSEGKSRRMLVHAFSNGGLAQMMAVARQARSGGTAKGSALAPAAVIFDSCPGPPPRSPLVAAPRTELEGQDRNPYRSC